MTILKPNNEVDVLVELGDVHCTIVTSEHLYQTIVQFDKTIVLPRKLAAGNIHDYLFCYCPLVVILFEVLRILCTLNRIPTRGQ